MNRRHQPARTTSAGRLWLLGLVGLVAAALVGLLVATLSVTLGAGTVATAAGRPAVVGAAGPTASRSPGEDRDARHGHGLALGHRLSHARKDHEREDGKAPGLALGHWLREHHRAGRRLAHRVLHAELTVRTRSGTRSVLLQRGRITEVTGDALRVRSVDGFVMTWVLTPQTQVRVDGHASAAGDLRTGQRARVRGRLVGSADPAARLVAERTAGRHARTHTG